MNRRDALSLTAITLGGAIVGSEMFLTGCTSDKKSVPAEGNNTRLLDEIGETILPETPGSPGARAAGIGEFMLTIVNDCYSPEEQEIFFDGMKKLDNVAQQQYSNGFVSLTADEKHQLLTAIDQEAGEHQENAPTHYFSMMKQLTVWGYFTSEPGCTQALRYNPVPGRYEGCVPYSKGDKAWA